MYEVVHRPGTRHGNADGLSRRPPEKDDTDEYIDGEGEPLKNEVRIIRGENEEGTSVLVGETLRQQKEEDPEFGEVIKLRLANSEAPNNEYMQTDLELWCPLAPQSIELQLDTDDYVGGGTPHANKWQKSATQGRPGKGVKYNVQIQVLFSFFLFLLLARHVTNVAKRSI